MYLKEAIRRADALRLNTVSEEQKAAWLSDLDGQLAEMFGAEPQENKQAENEPPKSEWPEDRELLMPPPHEELYQLYLVCKIDYHNQEMGLYANDLAIYNAALAEAQAWYRRHNQPACSGNWRTGI